MASGDVKLAMDGEFKYGAHGSSPSTVGDNCDAVKLGLSKEWAEWIRRGRKYKGAKPTVRNVTLEWTMVKVEGDTFLTTIKNAWLNDSRVALWPTDDTGEGMDGDFYVGDFNEDQDNQGAIIYNVSARLTDEGRQPSYH